MRKKTVKKPKFMSEIDSLVLVEQQQQASIWHRLVRGHVPTFFPSFFLTGTTTDYGTALLDDFFQICQI
jgi:hypothetical protein